MSMPPEIKTERVNEAFSAAADDEVLMARICQRQQDALGELYSRHAQTLRGLIGNIVHEESEADDVLQECFLQIWREAGSYSSRIGKPLAWVVTIARRRAIDRVRRRNSYRRAKNRFETESQPAKNTGFVSPATTKLASADLRRFFHLHMQSLPPHQREVVELTYFGGLSQREIAAATGTPLGTVKTRIQLGLQKLAQCTRPLASMI
jgi:RNA polymerase sigma-70 factor (ECF subfamily)